MTTSLQDNPTTRSPVPRKLDNTMIEALSTVIAEGNYYITACSLCGISEPAFYGWVKLAEKDNDNGLTEDESIYIRLVKSLKKAEAQAEANFLSVVKHAAVNKREWLPAMTFLERRHPDRWGRKDRNTVTIDERKTITITHVEVVKPQGYIDSEAMELLEGGEDE